MPRYLSPLVDTAIVAKPLVRASTSTVVVRNDTTVELKIRYSCASGHEPALYADIWQGGTLDEPVSLYNTEQPGAVVPVLTCDGKTYSATLTLVRVLFPPYELLGRTSGGFGLAHATVILDDLTTAHRSTSFEDVMVRS